MALNTMRSTSNLTRDQLHLMVREHAALEIAELEARVADLTDERDVMRFWWQRSLAALADLTAKYGRRQEDYQRLQDEVRDLRVMVVSECYDDAPTVLSPATIRAVKRSLSVESIVTPRTYTTKHGTEAVQ